MGQFLRAVALATLTVICIRSLVSYAQGPNCLFWEDFTGVSVGEIPEGWHRNNDRWGVHNTANADGSAPEMGFWYYPPLTEVAHLYVRTPLIDATVHIGLVLTFKHYVHDHWDPPGGYELRVVALTPSYDIVWELHPTENLGPETITVDLSSCDGMEFHLAFVFYGKTENINGWYIDDICVASDGIALPDEFQVRRETGDVLSPGAFYGAGTHLGGADLAEWVQVSEPVEPGHVLEIDPTASNTYRLACGPCSASVAGLVSTAPGIVLGGDLVLSSEFEVLGEGQAMLALLGVVPVKVTDEGGPIAVGDLLIVSSTPGYAMRWDLDTGGFCGLVGKALEPHEQGEGMIEVLLTR